MHRKARSYFGKHNISFGPVIMRKREREGEGEREREGGEGRERKTGVTVYYNNSYL